MPRKPWSHAPHHVFVPGAHFIVTAATHGRQHLLRSDVHLRIVRDALLGRAEGTGWNVEAWAILPNHYHFVARAPEQEADLAALMRAIHSVSARDLNRLDGTPGRKVWFQYWDTLITNERAYRARLHYVLRNPEKHGLVEKAEDYPWCSMREFMAQQDNARVRSVLEFPIDEVRVPEVEL